MFIAALFTAGKTENQTRCPSSYGWIKKMWNIHIYTMEYFSAVTKNDHLSFTAKWIKLEDIMLKEISQTLREKYHMFSLICRS